MARREQTRIQSRVRMMDDVFHNTIIALERLEVYLLRLRGSENPMPMTAINTDRDLHDDRNNPPSEQSLLGEMEVQCSALWFQTKTDGDERLEQSVKFFIEDLIAWYGGRIDFPYDEVERFFIPIMGSLSRQLKSVIEIQDIVSEYVTDKIKSIENLDEEQKRQAVEDGMKAWLIAQDKTAERFQQYQIEDEAFELTSHQRGSLENGYHRLYGAMESLYGEKSVPVQLLEQTISQYLPELLDTTAEDATAEDATAEDTTAEDATAEDTTAEDATAEDATAEDATAEDATAEDATAEDTKDK